MEIRSLYNLFLNRVQKADRKVQLRQEEKDAAPQAVPGDRRELSSLMAALQKMEGLEERREPVELERLERLEKEIDSGVYRVDPRKLAEAMLRSPGDRFDPRGEDS